MIYSGKMSFFLLTKRQTHAMVIKCDKLFNREKSLVSHCVCTHIFHHLMIIPSAKLQQFPFDLIEMRQSFLLFTIENFYFRVREKKFVAMKSKKVLKRKGEKNKHEIL